MEDQVIVEEAEVTEPVETGNEAEKVEVEATLDEEKKEEPVKEPEGEKKEPPAWAEKRFAEMTRKRREEESRRIEAEKESAYLRGQLDATKGGKPDAKAEDTEPRAESFLTYDDYVDARAEWKARKVVRAEREAEKAEREKESAQRTDNDRRERAMKQATEARKELDDFDDVLSNPDMPLFSKSVAEVINDSDVGAKIVYFLGKNMAEAERIAKLSPLAAAREIGKIEDKILNPPKAEPKRITDAGAPVKTVGEKGAREVNPSKMTDDEYFEWDAAEKLKKLKAQYR